MLLGFAALRLLDLRDARGVHPVKYQIVGAGRVLHRAAKAGCFICAAVPLLQLNGRIAEVMTSDQVDGIAPFQVVGALHV
jgi:hypothetical protein